MNTYELIEIDLTKVLNANKEEKIRWSKIVVDQFYKIGFLRCINIPGYNEKLLLKASNWFHLKHSTEEKMRYTTVRFEKNHKRNYRGYFPIIPNQNSYKECFEIGQWDKDADYSTLLQTFIQEAAQWPDFDGPDFTPRGGMSSIQFRETVRRQFEVYFAAARQLLELICIGLDIDQSKFDHLLENHASTFRLIHNPPRHDIIPEECKLKDGDVISVGEHHDTSIMTLLANYNYSGLQVHDRESDEWMTIDPKPNSFVVNVGIMLENMTGGRLRSTIHRVLDHGEERMSAPFFLEPGWDKELCDFGTGERWSEKLYGRWMIDYVKKFVEYKNLPSDL